MRFRERTGEGTVIPPPHFDGTLISKEIASNYFSLFVCRVYWHISAVSHQAKTLREHVPAQDKGSHVLGGQLSVEF